MFLAIERQSALRAFALHEKGFLPRAGGWLAQDEWWLQVLELIEVEVQKVKARAKPAPPKAPDDSGIED